jgi:hypothetical protein
MDNLSSHCSDKALVDFYGEERGAEIWKKFTVHYTPKHGSWLNQAEIECGLFGRQCLGKERVGDLASLKQRTRAWNQRVDRDHVKIDWTFTAEKAREKFSYRRHGGRGRPVAFGLRLRRSSLAHLSGARRSSLLGSLQNRPAKTAIISRSEH